MTISEEHSHRGIDIHITGSGLSGYFAVFTWNTREWVAGSDPDDVLEKACNEIDNRLKNYNES